MSDVDTELKDRNETPDSEREPGKMSFLEHLDELRRARRDDDVGRQGQTHAASRRDAVHRGDDRLRQAG